MVWDRIALIRLVLLLLLNAVPFLQIGGGAITLEGGPSAECVGCAFARNAATDVRERARFEEPCMLALFGGTCERLCMSRVQGQFIFPV